MSRLLFSYRTTPQSTTVTPAELLFGRSLRTRLDLVFPDVTKHVIYVSMENGDFSFFTYKEEKLKV